MTEEWIHRMVFKEKVKVFRQAIGYGRIWTCEGEKYVWVRTSSFYCISLAKMSVDSG